METRKEILDELMNLSPFVAGIQKTNLFSVPQGYFDSFSNSFLLNFEEKPELLKDLDNTSTFEAIPENYFSNLSAEILEKIQVNDENALLSALPAEIKNTETFTIPDGYFDTLSIAILSKINSSARASVVSINNYRKIFKYAVAAVIIGIVGLSTYKYFNKPSEEDVKAVITVAALDPTIEAGKNMSEQQFNEKLNSLSGDDIAKYLEKNGNETDIALLTIEGDGQALPEKDAFLPDELSLQNDLTEIITKN